MGRPRKNPGERKDDDLRIPMTTDQKRLVAEAAQLDHMDMAAWARPILIRMAESRIAEARGETPHPEKPGRGTKRPGG
jgi:hypothetical protein